MLFSATWTPVIVAEEAMSLHLQGVLVAKTLEYDKNIATAAGQGTVTIGVLYDGKVAEYSSNAKLLDAEFEAMQQKGVSIKGFKIKHVILPVGDASGLKDILKEKGVSAVCLFVSGDKVASVTKATRELKVLSIACTDPGVSVVKGVSVGLSSDKGMVKILLNTDSASQEGRDFSPDFMKIVTKVN